MTWVVIALVAIIIIIIFDGALRWAAQIGKYVLILGIVLFLASFILDGTKYGEYLSEHRHHIAEQIGEGIETGYTHVEDKLRALTARLISSHAD